MNHAACSLTFESIHYQSRDKFDALTKACGELRQHLADGQSNKGAIKESGIEKVIFDLFGIQVQFKIANDIGINAMVYPPALDRNHIFFNDIQKEILKDKDARSRLKKAKELEGEVDLVGAKVSGVFSEIESPCYLGRDLLMSKADSGYLFKDNEIAAILAHELGHLFTFYEYLTRSVVVNVVINDLAREFADANSYRQRVKIVDQAKTGLDLDALEPEVVAEVEGKETFQTWVISKTIHQKHNLTNTPVFDFRNCEVMADQFVSRLGAQRDLVSALDRLFKTVGVTSESRTQVTVLAIISSLLTLLALTSFWPVGVLTLLLMAFTVPYETYDPPVDRMSRIKNDLVNQLKRKDIPREEKRRLEQDYKKIETIIDQSHEIIDPITWVWKNIMPLGRHHQRKTEQIERLERLVSNPLYVRATEFELRS